ncbi:MAG: outer membrane beta-barrel protein [Bacteroidetes bacterium]|nr:outer membrane beta-barrel protein [Bacteroidota bacterium]
MKKLLAIALILMVASASQAQLFKKGDIVVGGGVGFATFTGDGMPVYATVDYGYNDEVGLGAFVAYYGYEEDVAFWGGKWKYTNIIIAAQGTYHKDYFKIDNLDTYATLILGYNKASVEWDGANNFGLGSPSAGGVIYAFGVGARYYFMPNLAADVRLGYGISAVQAGIAYKL